MKWCYNERHHGKGSIDGIRRAIKTKGFTDAMSGKIQVAGAKSLVIYADDAAKDVK